jgi:predicted ATPase
MITELTISNYRSIGPNVTIRPGRLSILIGPNGSGKSNILDVLSFVRDAVTLGLPAAITHRGGIDSVRRRSQGHPYNVFIGLKAKLPHGHAEYAFEITGDRLEEYRIKSEKAVIFEDAKKIGEFQREGQDWEDATGVIPRMDEQSLAITALGGAAGYKPLVDFLSQLTVYAIFPDTLRKAQLFDPARPMKRHGENWVSILRELAKEPAKDDLIVGLRKLTGDIEDVRVTSAAEYLVAEFKQTTKAKKGKRWFAASQQSDGTLRVAGLLTALLQTPPLPVIGIEEPELTVHPGALPMIYDYLKQASEVSQVLITTHSPIMLDVVDVEQDTIFVVNRVEGKTEIKRVSDEKLEPVRRSLLRLGDLFVSGELQLSLFDDHTED